MPQMYNMEQLVDAGLMPLALAKALNWECSCGWAIVQNDTGTIRRCANPYCPRHMAYRADYLFKYFRYMGVGPETAYKYILKHSLKSHFDLLDPKLYRRDYSKAGQLLKGYAKQEREVYLYQIAELASLPGLQSAAADIFNGYTSFEQYFKLCPRSDFTPYKDMLIDAQKYFKLRPVLSRFVYTVMISGSIEGFSSRENFIDFCNHKFGQFVFIKYSPHPLVSADALICDNQSGPITRKMEVALNSINYGVRMPIITSRQFLSLLEEATKRSNAYNNEEGGS